jgi:hypothetical protein
MQRRVSSVCLRPNADQPIGVVFETQARIDAAFGAPAALTYPCLLAFDLHY